MHIILGATGHIGSALTDALLDRDEPVTVVSRDVQKAARFVARGAKVAEVDVHDTDALRAVFARGERLFLLNPPADPKTDTALEERRTVQSILAAIEDSAIEKVVAESTYGAQPGEALGDLGVLYEMEQALEAAPPRATIIRGAYYMTNWDAALATAEQEGVVHTFFPIDFELPMVAPCDIGRLAARLLTEPVEVEGIHPIEGPRRYSASDVADAFGSALGKKVVAVTTPREKWSATFAELGFSPEAAASFIAMTEATLEARFPHPDAVTKGTTSLEAYVEQLVHSRA